MPLGTAGGGRGEGRGERGEGRGERGEGRGEREKRIKPSSQIEGGVGWVFTA